MPAQSGPDPIDELGAQLAESRRLLRSVIDQVPAMIGYWNRDLHNVLANEAYVDWFGMSPDEILGIHIREVLGEELFELNLPYMQAALGGVAQHFDRTIVDASGETRYSQADYVPDVDAAGRVIGFFVLVSDVTARTKAEMALVPLLAELEHRAMTDPLTGLANRRELTRRSEVALTDLGGHEPGTRFVGLLVLSLTAAIPTIGRFTPAGLSGPSIALATGAASVEELGADLWWPLLATIALIVGAVALAGVAFRRREL